MDGSGTQHELALSVLDRLSEPTKSGVLSQTGGTTRQLFLAIQRDLEALLNARRLAIVVPAEFAAVRDSSVTYGFPDVSMLHGATKTGRDNIAQLIAKTIKLHEPRLKDIRVTEVKTKDEEPYNARFAIHAILNVTPTPNVAFSTILNLATGRTTIRTGEPG